MGRIGFDLVGTMSEIGRGAEKDSRGGGGGTDGASSPVSVPPPLTVGTAFLKQFYHVLTNTPDMVHKFYRSSSVFSDGEGSNPSTPSSVESLGSRQATRMLDRFVRWSANRSDPLRFELENGSIDAQESVGGGILLVVMGHLCIGDTRKAFCHTFFLNKASSADPTKRQFYIHNDILRFVHEGTTVARTDATPLAAVVEEEGEEEEEEEENSNAGGGNGGDDDNTELKAADTDKKGQYLDTKKRGEDGPMKGEKEPTGLQTTGDEEQNRREPSGPGRDNGTDKVTPMERDISTSGKDDTETSNQFDDQSSSQPNGTPSARDSTDVSAFSEKDSGIKADSTTQLKGGQKIADGTTGSIDSPQGHGSWASMVKGAADTSSTATTITNTTSDTDQPTTKEDDSSRLRTGTQVMNVGGPKNEQGRDGPKPRIGIGSGTERATANGGDRMGGPRNDGAGKSTKTSTGDSKHRQQKRNPANTVVIKGIAEGTTENEVRSVFAPFAAKTGSSILHITVVNPRGMAFVDYDSSLAVQATLNEKQSLRLKGRPINVEQKAAEKGRNRGQGGHNGSRGGRQGGSGNGGGNNGSNNGGGGRSRNGRGRSFRSAMR